MHPSEKRKAPYLSGLLIVATLLMPLSVRAQQKSSSNGALQAFMLTTTYGVIAGSLTGLASLAFYDKAGEHSRNIAIGASLGLYMGLLLGTYVVYGPSLRKAMPTLDSGEEEDLDDPMNLGAQLDLALPVPGSYQASTTPWVNWDPKKGAQVGLIYNF